MKPKEINEGILAGYIESRYGLNQDGMLQAFSSIEKELTVLQRLLREFLAGVISWASPPISNLKERFYRR